MWPYRNGATMLYGLGMRLLSYVAYRNGATMLYGLGIRLQNTSYGIMLAGNMAILFYVA